MSMYVPVFSIITFFSAFVVVLFGRFEVALVLAIMSVTASNLETRADL